MADQPQFFNQWEAPPGYAPPPASDDALVQRISKLVEFASRNGPSFVELIKKKQKVSAEHFFVRSTLPELRAPLFTLPSPRHSTAFGMQDNAEYAFLFDGAGSKFYRWALYCKLYGLPMDQKPPQPQQDQQPAQHAAAREAEALPPDVDSGFSQVLAALSGSKVTSLSPSSFRYAVPTYIVEQSEHTCALPARRIRHVSFPAALECSLQPFSAVSHIPNRHRPAACSAGVDPPEPGVVHGVRVARARHGAHDGRAHPRLPGLCSPAAHHLPRQRHPAQVVRAYDHMAMDLANQ